MEDDLPQVAEKPAAWPRAPMSVGADKAYDTRDFVKNLRRKGVRPHVSQNLKRPGGSAIDQRTTRHDSYQISQKKRPSIGKAFGWMKQIGGDAQDQAPRTRKGRLAVPDDRGCV